LEFERELERALPADLPSRDSVITKSAQHLQMIVEANEYLNLTRIVSPFEAAVKHVLDSVAPWRLFEGARRIVDAGTGAGFPGIPLALVLPNTRFTLVESIQKKARFVERAVAALELPNATVSAQRAEELTRDGSADMIVARALTPVSKALDLFGPALKRGTRIFLYKGPDVEREIAEAARPAEKLRAQIRVALQFDLPNGMGSRRVVEIGIKSAR
jgi:16S rRNA (guanine527-N7)-methyltransferase